jgi:hypothetical protein
MTQRRGADFRVLLNGTFYAVARIEVGGRCPPDVVSNTEGVPGNPLAAIARGFSAIIGDLAEGTMRLVSATFDDANNPYAAPFDVDIGEYVSIIAFPSGAGFGYNYGNCLVLSYSHSGQVPGLQPLTIEVQTDGLFDFVAL